MSLLDREQSKLLQPGAESSDATWTDISNDKFGGKATQTAGLQLLPIKGCNDVLLTIRPPSGPPSLSPSNSAPIDLIILLDVSMGMTEIVSRPYFTNGNDLLCATDVATSTINSVNDRMSDQDRLALITFDALPTTIQPLQHVTKEIKKQIAHKVGRLELGQGSSLMAALCTALNSLGEPQIGRSRAVFVLSCGKPNNVDLKDLENLHSLLQASDRNQGAAPKIFTFGTGSNCGSNTLYSIADVGHGTFSLIEDQGSADAAVARAMTEVKLVFSTSATVEIEWSNSQQSFTVPAHLKTVTTDISSVSIDIGSLEYNRPYALILSGKGPLKGTITANLEYHTLYEKDKTTISELALGEASNEIDDGSWVTRVRFRAKICDLLWQLFRRNCGSKAPYDLASEFRSFQDGLDDLVVELKTSQHRKRSAQCDFQSTGCERPVTEDPISEMYQDASFISEILKDDQVRYDLCHTDGRTSAVLATFLHAHIRQMCTTGLLVGPVRR